MLVSIVTESVERGHYIDDLSNMLAGDVGQVMGMKVMCSH